MKWEMYSQWKKYSRERHLLPREKIHHPFFVFVVVVQSISHVRLVANPWTAALQASLSFTISQSLLKFISIESVMPSNHLVLCHPPLLPHSIFPSIGVFQMSQFFSSGGQRNAYIFHLLGFSSIQSLKTLLHESLEAEAWSYPKAVLLFLGCSSLIPAFPLFLD